MNRGGWRLKYTKRALHTEKYRFFTGAAVIKEMLIVDADVNMMCGKVALHFQQPWRSLITRLSDNDSVQQMPVCEIKQRRFEFVIYQWNPFEAQGAKGLTNLADFKDSTGLLGQHPLACPAGTRQGEDRRFTCIHERYIASLYIFLKKD